MVVKVIAGEGGETVQRWQRPQLQPYSDASAEEQAQSASLQSITEEEINELREQARQQGYQEGMEEGRKAAWDAAKPEVEARLGQLEAMLQTLNAPLQQIHDAVEQELVALAVAIAKQVVRRELKTDPGQVVAVVREALGILPANDSRLRLLMHPDDAVLLNSVMAVSEKVERIDVIEDPAVLRGGVRVESDESQIDATVETRIAEIAAVVMGGERRND